ncbi:hypothetical protein G9A89_013363 [Geosiphon pyriformis]|nr:hypothetical protein G9A89_013363 [Geosiphon pyriformis]
MSIKEVHVSTQRHRISHSRESSLPHEVKESLNASITETQDGERCLNNYILKEVIGQGAYGTVNLAVDKNTGDKFAIKEFSKSRLRKKDKSNFLRRPRGGWRGGRGRGIQPSTPGTNHDTSNPLYLIRTEVAILKKLNHPNVVRLFEVLDDPNNDSLYMVFEMCEKGVLMDISIHKKSTPFSEEKLRRYFRDMILGFEYLHENEIVHRDIKPDNLLLSKDDVLKIVDFGVSEIFVKGNDKMKKSAGSPAFMAPELCKAHHGEVSGKATDIWSMGVTLYCLNFGCLPFEKDNLLDLYNSIKNDDVYLPPGMDPNLLDLFHKILDKDPQTRIAMPELREHPWVTEDGTNPLISTEENFTDLVTEITDDEYRSAIRSITSIMTVIDAVRRFKRASRHHASLQDLSSLKACGDEGKKDPEPINEHISTLTVVENASIDSTLTVVENAPIDSAPRVVENASIDSTLTMVEDALIDKEIIKLSVHSTS